jgi:hypothetical protein
MWAEELSVNYSGLGSRIFLEINFYVLTFVTTCDNIFLYSRYLYHPFCLSCCPGSRLTRDRLIRHGLTSVDDGLCQYW